MNSLEDPTRKRSTPHPTSTLAQEKTLRGLYDQYGHTVYCRARALLGDPDRAQDATQEVFLRALRAPGHLGAYAFPWLYRVTTNLCLNNLRDDRRRQRILAESRFEVASKDDADARLTVKQLLSRVPDSLKRVVFDYYVENLSYDDIAARVGVSRRTIGNRLAAFHALTDELCEEEIFA
jgi:RNA polymerase sigma-70 factor (ECF subfamily)